ncbi:MAG TPA: NF038122 family metalloprotease [Chthoniobacterales bacterium]|nr:NF038122 family metalloprotease [Chthoniobacterales bacterium]
MYSLMMMPFNALRLPITAALCRAARAILPLFVVLSVGVMGVPQSKGDVGGSPITVPPYDMGVRERSVLANNPPPATAGEPESYTAPTLKPQAGSAPQVPTTGLVINPTFDTSITSNPNSAAIQSAINQAIANYQALFSESMTVSIYFRFASTNPGGTPLPAGVVASSRFVFYTIPWNTYVNALRADAKTANDSSANATLPTSPLSTSVEPSSADGRAVGLNTPPAMFSNGNVGAGGPYDGIVTLNSSVGFQFTRPTPSNKFDAVRSLEHEIDEVLGLSSYIGVSSNLEPQDLFSWASPGVRNTTSSGSRYFSINGGQTNIVDFNQTAGQDFGDWLSDPCPQVNPYVQNASSCPGQYSDVTATSPEGINLDVVGYDLVGGAAPTQLLNIATRLNVLTGDNVLIGGLIITGGFSKKVMLRGMGPSVPISGALSDPTLELHFPNGSVVTNSNWKINDATGQSQEAELRATGLAPTSDLESAMVQTLPPGAYTAIVRGANDGTGIGLVEAYDLDQASASKLGNISTRGFVDMGNNVMIGGLILGPAGTGSGKVLMRAIGPSLSVPQTLPDPTLVLRNANGDPIATNDNWKINDSTGQSQETEIRATGLAPSNDLESIVITILPPGSYTAIVAGKNGQTGVGLVEVYKLD